MHVRELQRRLAAELHDDALERSRLALLGEDGEHVLGGQRLEIEAIRSVVVGRHGLRIAIDHDRLVARFAQRERGVAAAIVELDALPDAVGPAAENDDLLAPARSRFAGGDAGERRLVGRIHVGGRRREFGGAGVDALVDRRDAERRARLGDVALVEPGERAEARVGEAGRLQQPQIVGVLRQAEAAHLVLEADDFRHPLEEPRSRCASAS